MSHKLWLRTSVQNFLTSKHWERGWPPIPLLDYARLFRNRDVWMPQECPFLAVGQRGFCDFQAEICLQRFVMRSVCATHIRPASCNEMWSKKPLVTLLSTHSIKWLSEAAFERPLQRSAGHSLGLLQTALSFGRSFSLSLDLLFRLSL